MTRQNVDGARGEPRLTRADGCPGQSLMSTPAGPCPGGPPALREQRRSSAFSTRLAWAIVTFAKSERAELCDLLDALGPDAPTLCEGWNAHDLAAHLWIRETDPVGATSMVAKPLAGLLERRMAEVKARWEFAELVNRVRRGPARVSVFAFPGVDEGANTTEFFVHHEDVRRAGNEPHTSRDLGPEVEEWMW